MAASKDAIKLQWTENKLKKVEAERDEAVASATLLQTKLREVIITIIRLEGFNTYPSDRVEKKAVSCANSTK